MNFNNILEGVTIVLISSAIVGLGVLAFKHSKIYKLVSSILLSIIIIIVVSTLSYDFGRLQAYRNYLHFLEEVDLEVWVEAMHGAGLDVKNINNAIRTDFDNILNLGSRFNTLLLLFALCLVILTVLPDWIEKSSEKK